MIRATLFLAGIGGVAGLLAQVPGSSQSALAFEVASVKQSSPMPPEGVLVRSGSAQPGGRWIAQNARFIDILRSVYREYSLRNQIVGGPAWVNTVRFDINAKSDSDEPSADQMTAMAKQLLAGRFGLRVHPERREMDVYALVLARSDGQLGPQLRRVDVDCQAVIAARKRGEGPPAGRNERPLCTARLDESPGALRLVAGALPISGLLSMIQGSVREPILDRTNLAGRFDIDLDWAAEATLRATPAASRDDNNAPTLLEALQRQLGLKLELRKELMDVLVIDSVHLPTPD